MSGHIEKEQFQPVLRPLARTKQELRFPPIRNLVPIWKGQPTIVDNFPPQRVGGEFVLNFWDFGTVEEDERAPKEVSTPILSENFLRQAPYFPTKIDDVFQMALTNREILPFVTQDDYVNSNDAVNVIAEQERREAIAKLVAKIVIRVSTRLPEWNS